MCKFVYIFRTDENPFGSCQPCTNNIHITYDDNTAAHWATVDKYGDHYGKGARACAPLFLARSRRLARGNDLRIYLDY